MLAAKKETSQGKTSILETLVLETCVPSYYRARYYDPTTGRFAREDPIRFVGDINFYSYTRNNPIALNDPFGGEPNGPGACGGTTDCDKYKQLKRYDLYLICRAFPNDPKSNCIRLCLQQSFSAGSRGVGSYNDPPIWGGFIGGDAMNGLGQAFGPFTHLLCFKQCGLF